MTSKLAVTVAAILGFFVNYRSCAKLLGTDSLS